MPTGSNLHIRSTEVSEIISQKPSFLIRWGISIFFLILILIFIACWFIHYPEVVTTTAKLTGINTPKEVKTKVDGRIIEIFFNNNDTIKENDTIAYMESRANAKDVLELAKELEEMEHQLQSNSNKLLLKNFISTNNLGELQQSFQTFIQSFTSFKQYLNQGFYSKKKKMLLQDINYINQQYSNLLTQKNYQEEDVTIQQKNFDANELLEKQKVISAFDYRNEKSKLINKKLSIPQINTAIISNKQNRHEKQKEISELENTISQQKILFIQSLNTFKAAIADWKSKYLIIAPINGTIYYTTFLQQNQQLQNNQSFCFINPFNASYYAQAIIPQTNFGKIKVGQKVLLKLPSYPYQEFGFIEGKLEFISRVPSDTGYLAKIILPNGLKTNYNKTIQFWQGLTASLEIITEDMSLLQRFTNNLKYFYKY